MLILEILKEPTHVLQLIKVINFVIVVLKQVMYLKSKLIELYIKDLHLLKPYSHKELIVLDYFLMVILLLEQEMDALLKFQFKQCKQLLKVIFLEELLLQHLQMIIHISLVELTNQTFIGWILKNFFLNYVILVIMKKLMMLLFHITTLMYLLLVQLMIFVFGMLRIDKNYFVFKFLIQNAIVQVL